MKTLEDVTQFLKDAQTYYLATADGDQPHVRPFGTAHIYNGRLYIQTGRSKDVSHQLDANGRPRSRHVQGQRLRICGRLAGVTTRLRRKRVMLDAYPSLRRMYSENDGNTIVYYFEKAVATRIALRMPPRSWKSDRKPGCEGMRQPAGLSVCSLCPLQIKIGEESPRF